MNRIAIYGAGGFGKEVRAFAEGQGMEIAGFIDDGKPEISLSADDLFDDVVLAIASPAIRYQLIRHWARKVVPFESLIHSGFTIHRSVAMGRGCIVCAGVQMTVDITIGEFVIINLNATIGHDVRIGNFSSLMPGVNISGNVTLGERVFIGSGATILQGLTIGDGAVIGAGAVVTKDVAPGVTVMGVPARPRL